MQTASHRDGSGSRHATPSTIAIGLAMVALGIFVGYEGFALKVSPSYAQIGPRVFPMVIAVGLVLIGLTLTVLAVRGTWTARLTDTEPGDVVPDWRDRPVARIAFVAFGLILDVILMRPAGFIVASSVMFGSATYGFGSRRPLMNVAIGAVMSTVIFLFFNRVLGVRLPAGWLWT